MLRSIRSRLTYANVMATIAVFIALATGGAYAANTIYSTDIVDGQVKSIDIEDSVLGDPSKGIQTADLGDSSVNSVKLKDGAIKLQDIGSAARDVFRDDCNVENERYGYLCAYSDGVHRDFADAAFSCALMSLHLPTWSEALSLALVYDVPQVGASPERFWTAEAVDEIAGRTAPNNYSVIAVDEGGNGLTVDPALNSYDTVCVRPLSNY
jgi:hypothetical protein